MHFIQDALKELITMKKTHKLLVAVSVMTLTPASFSYGATFFDTYDRDSVVQYYDTVYNAAKMTDPMWTGNIETCEPGDVSQGYRDATLGTINWVRKMAGISRDVSYNSDANRKAQEGAFLMAANEEHSHFPPTSWRCWTQDGYDGLSNSNTGIMAPISSAFGVGMHSVREGGTNDRVGHRVHLLRPSLRSIGTGYVVAPYYGHKHIYQTEYIDTRSAFEDIPTREDFIAWPPPGFNPYQTVYSKWHIAIQGVRGVFDEATVVMTVNGKDIPLTANPSYRTGTCNGFVDVLVWNPYAPYTDSVDYPHSNSWDLWPQPDQDMVYTVTIKNVSLGGVKKDISYGVGVIDPATSGNNVTLMPVSIIAKDGSSPQPPVTQKTVLTSVFSLLLRR